MTADHQVSSSTLDAPSFFIFFHGFTFFESRESLVLSYYKEDICVSMNIRSYDKLMGDIIYFVQFCDLIVKICAILRICTTLSMNLMWF